MGADDQGGSELLSRVQVVDGASLHFRDYGEARHDTWEIEWEATPAPADRAAPPQPTSFPPAADPVDVLEEPELEASPSPPPREKPRAPSVAEAFGNPPRKRPRSKTRSAIPDVLPSPVYVPAPDATPAAADRKELEEVSLDDLEELDEIEPVEPEPIEEEPDTFPPLSDLPPTPVHKLHAPGSTEPTTGDRAPTWDPPTPQRTQAPPQEVPSYVLPEVSAPPRAPEPGGYALPPEITRQPRTGVQAVDALPAVFAGLSPRTVEAAVEHFDIFQVKEGTRLISEGERHPALVMVLGGELLAERSGTYRRAEAGDCLGFTTLFGDGTWATTVRARVPSRLLVLNLEGFRALRAQGSVVSVAIEEYALDLLMSALDRARQRVAQLSTRQPLETFVPKPKFFELLADAFGMGGILATKVDGPKALASSPLFRNAEATHLTQIAERLEGLKAQSGSFFVKQGDSATSMFLVVSGQVDVLTSNHEDKAVRHETLGPGEMFGMWALLREQPSRTTVVARTKCVVLELEKLAWAELAPAHTGVGSVLRLAVLRALTSQLVRESARMASLEAGHAPKVEASTSGSFMTIDPIDRR